MRAFIAFILLIGLSSCIQFDVKEEQFFLPDNRVDEAYIAQQFPGYRMRDLALKGHDGVLLYGRAFIHENATATILYWGGNQFRVRDGVGPIVDVYLKHPINLVLMDHRGYGYSMGRPSLADLQLDGVAVYDQIHAMFTHTPLVVNGYSLGSFTAAFVANEREVDGLILEASATSARGWAEEKVPWFARPFVSVNIDPKLSSIDNIATARRQKGSVLIAVGEDDDFTPPSLSRVIFEAVQNARYKDFVLAKNAAHGKAKLTPEFSNALGKFLHSLPEGSHSK